MKKNVLIAVAFFATLSVSAQSIAAVSPSNVTTMYQTLDKALVEADNGSVIYLPGGGFQISEDTKITKKFTIMGVSHRVDTDNADGATVIAGNLNFEKGSDGSSVVGAYVSGNINVGTGTDSVLNLTLRFCNVNSIQVKHSQSSGMTINQCYLRNNSSFGNCNVCMENNILHSAWSISGGTINHNIITSGVFKSYLHGSSGGSCALYSVNNSSITNNIFLDPGLAYQGSNCMVYNNAAKSNYAVGEERIELEENMDWDNLFIKNKGVNINSDYHFKEGVTWGKGAGTDGTDIGIYGGSGFKEPKETVAPIPRIVSKEVADHTDGSGMLTIKVRVKAE